MKLLGLITVIVMLYANALIEHVYTKRSNNYLREGPGAYFKLVDILPLNEKLEIIERKNSWIKVESANNSVGWLAANSLANISKGNDIVSELSKTWSSKSASKSGLAAAIKGLKGKSKSTITGDTDSLLALLDTDITGAELAKFYHKIAESNSSNKGELNTDDLGLDIPEYDPDLSEQQIGFGVASRIAMDGIIKNRNLNKYVNLIAQSLVATSLFYDWEFNVLILDSKKHDGYACPGGYIFITTGAIKSCDDESELASIIAHEISHVIRRHGLQEITKRESHIKMDEAFRELDEETGDVDAVVEELENMMLSSYERIVHKRLLDYEIEADEIASVLCANTGYDPFGIVRVTRRFSGLYEKTEDIFDENYLSQNDMAKRADNITDFTADEFSKENAGARLDRRFKKYKEMIN